jgi:hypothetical protein
MLARMVVVIVLGVVAMGLWILGAVLFVVARKRMSTGVPMTAEVTGFASFVDRGQTMYCAQYRAVLPDGRAVTGAATTSKSWKSPNVGTRVPVRYHADNPENALTDTSFVPYIAPLVLFAVGGLLGAFAGAAGVSIMRAPDDVLQPSAPHTTHPHHRN